MSGLTPVEEMIARTAIRHTQSIYNNTGDRGKIDEMMLAFKPDGVLAVPQGDLVGREAIKAFLVGVASGGTVNLRNSRHNLTTSRIEFDGPDKADGWTYFMVTRAGKIIQSGIYIDRYEKVGEQWLIANRRVKLEHDDCD